MSSLTISRLMSIFGIIVTAGLLAAFAIQNYSLNTLKVDGPLYHSIAERKDFVADMLPPPLFVVEAYAAAYEANFHEERRADALARIGELKKQFDVSRSRWQEANLSNEERDVFEHRLLTSADTFWSVVTGDFMNVVGKDYTAVDPVMEKLADSYLAERNAVIELNRLATEKLTIDEDYAGAESAFLSSFAMIAGIGSILIFIGGVIFLRMRAIAPLSRMTEVMGDLANGRYDVKVPHADRKDEIGSIARALGVFRDSGIAKLAMEREAEAALIARREKRIAREAESQQRADEVRHVVETLGESLERLSDCNIRMTIDDPFAGDFEAIRHNFNRAIAAFQVTLERVLEGTRDIQDGSQELSTAADDMSRRTEQQAAALEETAAALEEINGTITTLSGNTRETRALVSNARSSASGSSEVVGRTVAAMQRIEESAREIGQIIGVIDEIAFQTNLLALNAGVEAARAGESGKGFAVVAQEVRELAQRSAAAAKQIKELVANSATQVSEGVKLVDETGRVLHEITDFVSKIDENIETIASGIQEQATGIRETTAAIHELDVTTQKNAAMAEQTSVLSRGLADQATLLATEAGKFKLNRRQIVREPGNDGATGGGRQRAA